MPHAPQSTPKALGDAPEASTDLRSKRARRRATNRAAYYAERARAARTPLERVAVAWDQWRSTVQDLPEEHAHPLADQLLTLITSQINHIARRQRRPEEGDRS